jgi:hypothetical protein
MKRLLIFLLLVPSLALTQNSGKISGRVVEAKTGQTIPSVNVVIRGTSTGAATDIEGSYFILNVPPASTTSLPPRSDIGASSSNTSL